MLHSVDRSLLSCGIYWHTDKKPGYWQLATHDKEVWRNILTAPDSTLDWCYAKSRHGYFREAFAPLLAAARALANRDVLKKIAELATPPDICQYLEKVGGERAAASESVKNDWRYYFVKYSEARHKNTYWELYFWQGNKGSGDENHNFDVYDLHGWGDVYCRPFFPRIALYSALSKGGKEPSASDLSRAESWGREAYAEQPPKIKFDKCKVEVHCCNDGWRFVFQDDFPHEDKQEFINKITEEFGLIPDPDDSKSEKYLLRTLDPQSKANLPYYSGYDTVDRIEIVQPLIEWLLGLDVDDKPVSPPNPESN
jgi:hypothetical protein